MSQIPPAEKAEALSKGSGIVSDAKQSTFGENAEFEFMSPSKKYNVPVVNLGGFRELDCKDAGINYQRVSVGMQEKGKGDLADRLLYEGRREKPEHTMYWKGSDIDRYWIAQKTSRFCRPNYQDYIRGNEVVHLNVPVYDRTPKILLRQTADRIIATIDYRGVWFGRSIIAIVASDGSPYRLEYFLGLLNSRYFLRLYSELVQETGRVFAQVKLSKIKQLPIRRIDFTKASEKTAHDAVVAKVAAMLEAKQQWAKAKTDTDRQTYERECHRLDRQIDVLVYELYGLTDDERKIVEAY